MNDGALISREFAESGGEFGAEGGFVGVVGRGEGGELFRAELLVVFGARAAAAHQVNRGIVGEAQEKGAFVAGVGEQIGLAGEFDENFLEDVARVGFVAGEIQKEREQRWRVFVVEPFEFGRHRNAFC